MATIELSQETAELAALFQGMSRADRDAVLKFARIRKAKYQSKVGTGAVVGNLTVSTVRNSRGDFLDAISGKV